MRNGSLTEIDVRIVPNTARMVATTLLLLTAISYAFAASFETRGNRECMTLDQAQWVAVGVAAEGVEK